MDKHGTAGAVIRWTTIPNAEAEESDPSKLMHDKAIFKVTEWLTRAAVSDNLRDEYFKLEVVSYLLIVA